MLNNSKTITIETKIKDEGLYPSLEEFSSFYCHLERKLFNDIVNAPVVDSKFRGTLKTKYANDNNMPVRIFNALWVSVNAKIQSANELHKLNIKDIESKIKSIEKKIKKTEFILSKKNISGNIQKMKANLCRWKKSLNKMESKIDIPYKTHIMFGSKDFYKKQWTVYDGKHDEWLNLWRNARNNHFSFIGSKDESNGNQLCQYFSNKKELRVTLPYSFKGRYLVLPVDFSSKDNRRQSKYYSYFTDAVKNKQALSFKFLKRDNGKWYVQCSFEISSESQKTYNGTLGIDFNYNNIVLVEGFVQHIEYARNNCNGNKYKFKSQINNPL